MLSFTRQAYQSYTFNQIKSNQITMQTKTYRKYHTFITENLITCDISYRGGQLKIDASRLFPSIIKQQDEGEEIDATCGAYQNYLGGGMAGRIQAGTNIHPDQLKTAKERKDLSNLLEALKMYFYDLNNGGGDEYMQEEVTGSTAGGYKKNQTMPTSGY